MPAAGTEITKNLTLVDIATASHAVLIHLNEFSYRAVVCAFDIVGEETGGEFSYSPVILYALTASALP